MLKDPAAATRSAAASALGSLGEAAGPYAANLAQLFREEALGSLHLAEAAVRRAAFSGLLKLGSSGSAEAASLLADSSASVKRAALHALGHLSQEKENQLSGSMHSAVAGVAALLAAANDASAQQAALHALALMGEAGACEVAGATAGSGAAARALRTDASGDAHVAEARLLPAARQHAEAKLLRRWQTHEKPGTGICFVAVPEKAEK